METALYEYPHSNGRYEPQCWVYKKGHNFK